MPSKANMRKPALQRNKPKDRGKKMSGGQRTGFTKGGAKRSPKAKHGKGAGTSAYSFKKQLKKGNPTKPKVGYKGHQGYAAREDESLGMRTGKEAGKKQSMKDRRDESYGAWGKRKGGKVNKPGKMVATKKARKKGNK